MPKNLLLYQILHDLRELDEANHAELRNFIDVVSVKEGHLGASLVLSS
jgi:hypothetical protein